MKSPVAKFAATAVAALAFLWSTGAQAHTHLVAASPPEDVASPTPKQVRLEFSEPLQPMFSGFEVVGSDGIKVLDKGAVDKTNRKLMTGAVKGPLKPGAYTVNWHAVSTDSHRTSGNYSFKIK